MRYIILTILIVTALFNSALCQESPDLSDYANRNALCADCWRFAGFSLHGSTKELRANGGGTGVQRTVMLPLLTGLTVGDTITVTVTVRNNTNLTRPLFVECWDFQLLTTFPANFPPDTSTFTSYGYDEVVITSSFATYQLRLPVSFDMQFITVSQVLSPGQSIRIQSIETDLGDFTTACATSCWSDPYIFPLSYPDTVKSLTDTLPSLLGHDTYIYCYDSLGRFVYEGWMMGFTHSPNKVYFVYVMDRGVLKFRKRFIFSK